MDNWRSLAYFNTAVKLASASRPEKPAPFELDKELHTLLTDYGLTPYDFFALGMQQASVWNARNKQGWLDSRFRKIKDEITEFQTDFKKGYASLIQPRALLKFVCYKLQKEVVDNDTDPAAFFYFLAETVSTIQIKGSSIKIPKVPSYTLETGVALGPHEYILKAFLSVKDDMVKDDMANTWIYPKEASPNPLPYQGSQKQQQQGYENGNGALSKLETSKASSDLPATCPWAPAHQPNSAGRGSSAVGGDGVGTQGGSQGPSTSSSSSHAATPKKLGTMGTEQGMQAVKQAIQIVQQQQLLQQQQDQLNVVQASPYKALTPSLKVDSSQSSDQDYARLPPPFPSGLPMGLPKNQSQEAFPSPLPSSEITQQSLPTDLTQTISQGVQIQPMRPVMMAAPVLPAPLTALGSYPSAPFISAAAAAGGATPGAAVQQSNIQAGGSQSSVQQLLDVLNKAYLNLLLVEGGLLLGGQDNERYSEASTELNVALSFQAQCLGTDVVKEAVNDYADGMKMFLDTLEGDGFSFSDGFKMGHSTAQRVVMECARSRLTLLRRHLSNLSAWIASIK